MNDIAAFATHTPLLSVVFSLQVSSYNSFFLVSILTKLQERFAFTNIFSTFVYNVSPTNKTKIMFKQDPISQIDEIINSCGFTGKKKQLIELLKEYAAEKKAPALDADAAETVNVLLTVALTAIELMGEGSEDAASQFNEAINTERHNRVTYAAEQQAAEADWDGWEWDRPNSDNCPEVIAWHSFIFNIYFDFDDEAVFEAAYNEALPSNPQD